MKKETDPSKLSPLGDACLRKDLDAIHENLVKSQIEDDKKVLEVSLTKPNLSSLISDDKSALKSD